MGVAPELLAQVRQARNTNTSDLADLARALKAALGVDAHYVRRGVISRGRVVSLRALVGDTSFGAELSGGKLRYTTGAAVRGVVSISTERARDEWYAELESALESITNT